MKTNTVIEILAIAALALPAGLTAQQLQDAREPKKGHHHYKLFAITTFGGPGGGIVNPSALTLNERGMLVGVGDTSMPDPFAPKCFTDCFVSHGFLWQEGEVTDLGALPGGAGSIPAAINERGWIAEQSQNGAIDPLTGWPEAHAVLWRKGQITDLGTLGGNQSNPNAMNNHGGVVGAALTSTADPFANSPTAACIMLPFTGSCAGLTFAQNSVIEPGATETHAFWWRNGLMLDLGTLGGPDSNAWNINDRGEITGWSYTSFVANPSTGVPTVDPFFWSPEDGKLIDMGSLGGTFGNPVWLNNRGQVTGASNLAGDVTEHPFLWSKSEGMRDLGTLGGTFGHPNWINDAGEVVGFSQITGDHDGHAFLWRHGVMTDLGTVGSDPDSEATNVNSQGQVVGGSFSFALGADLHGFLWEDGGPIVDLNTLILPGSGVTVTSALLINDRGEIACLGTSSVITDLAACVLIPCDENHYDIEGCDFSLVNGIDAQQTDQGDGAPQTHAPITIPTLSRDETISRFRSRMARRRRGFGVPAQK
jgi:probable HAF family extracellular repeat protein